MERQSPGFVTHATFYFIYYAYLGLFRPFVPSFLDHSGLSALQIGQVFILISVFTLFAAPIWGKIADRYGSRAMFLTLFPLLTAFCLVPVVLVPKYSTALALAVLQGAFVVPLIPLSDSVAMERCGQNGWGYGRLRMWGTVGFMCTSGVGGFVAERLGWLSVMVLMIIFAVLLAGAGWSLRAGNVELPQRANWTEKGGSKSSRLAVFPILFFLGTILYQTAFGTYNLFFGIHLEGISHSSKWISVAWVIGTLSEIIFFYFSDRIAEKVRPTGLMAIAMTAGVVRWFGMSVFQSLPMILSLQIFHGVMIGGFTRGAVGFAHQAFSNSEKAWGQGLHNAAYNGLGGLLAAASGGVVYAQFGAPKAFLFSSVLCLSSLVCLAVGPVRSLRDLSLKPKFQARASGC